MKHVFMALTHFLLGLLRAFTVERWEFLYSRTWSSVRSAFMGYSTKQKLFILMESHLLIFPFMAAAFRVKVKNSLPSPGAQRLSPVFFSLQVL